MNTTVIRCCVLLFICLVQVPVKAQDVNLGDYIHLIEREGSQYSGPGMDWILSHASDRQFVLFGEPHGVEDVPRMVGDIYGRLQTYGFKHLILEIDATTTDLLTDIPLSEFIARYPHSIAFDYDEELQMMDKVQSAYPGEQVIWGMDQMTTAIHAFQILEGVAKKVKTKRVCRGLHIKAALKAGRYISEENFSDLDKLQELLEEEENSEGLEILSQIRTSMEIYTAYFSATRGEISYEFSSGKREEYMKDWFDDFTEKAGQRGKLPKAIVKMGGAHTGYGVGPNNVLTLGDHLDKLAKKAGSSILSLGISYTSDEATFPPRALFKGRPAMLLDHKALLDEMDSTSLASLPEGLLQRLTYFDANIYLNNPVRSLKQVIAKEDEKFKNRAIGRLIPYAVLVLLNLSLLVPLFKWLFMKTFKADRARPYIKYHALLFVLSLIFDLVLIAQILSVVMGTPVASPTVMNTGLSFLIFFTLCVLSGLAILVVRRAKAKDLWSRGMIRHYRLVATGNVLLVLYMYYWNMGGMLA